MIMDDRGTAAVFRTFCVTGVQSEPKHTPGNQTGAAQTGQHRSHTNTSRCTPSSSPKTCESSTDESCLVINEGKVFKLWEKMEKFKNSSPAEDSGCRRATVRLAEGKSGRYKEKNVTNKEFGNSMLKGKIHRTSTCTKLADDNKIIEKNINTDDNTFRKRLCARVLEGNTVLAIRKDIGSHERLRIADENNLDVTRLQTDPIHFNNKDNCQTSIDSGCYSEQGSFSSCNDSEVDVSIAECSSAQHEHCEKFGSKPGTDYYKQRASVWVHEGRNVLGIKKQIGQCKHENARKTYNDSLGKSSAQRVISAIDTNMDTADSSRRGWPGSTPEFKKEGPNKSTGCRNNTSAGNSRGSDSVPPSVNNLQTKCSDVHKDVCTNHAIERRIGMHDPSHNIKASQATQNKSNSGVPHNSRAYKSQPLTTCSSVSHRMSNCASSTTKPSTTAPSTTNPSSSITFSTAKRSTNTSATTQSSKPKCSTTESSTRTSSRNESLTSRVASPTRYTERERRPCVTASNVTHDHRLVDSAVIDTSPNPSDDRGNSPLQRCHVAGQPRLEGNHTNINKETNPSNTHFADEGVSVDECMTEFLANVNQENLASFLTFYDRVTASTPYEKGDVKFKFKLMNP